MAEIVLGRLKFKWQGEWQTATSYIKDDVVRYGSSSYVCIANHTSGTWATDLADSKWELMIEGGLPTTTLGDLIYHGASQNERLPIGNPGQALIVNDDGYPEWTGLSTAQSIYYVKADGNDSNNGSNLNEAFKTIKHACDTVTGPATIYVKGGLYYEQLPIRVAANVTVVGDGQRNTGVAPLKVTAVDAQVAPQSVATTSTTIVVADGDTLGGPFQVNCTITGTQITGTVTVTNVEENTPTPGFTTLTVSFDSQVVVSDTTTISSDYSEGTMWLLNDGALLNKMYFKDMAGWEPNLSYPEDITQTTAKGVFVALDPANPVLNKSPYVIECAAFSELGAIGAIVDGDVHATGIKSMVFHGYTIVNSDGVGYWVHGEGKAEIVSCFTYYCWFGYTTTNGGKIRALNGNNSYGTYGVISRGFLATETPVTGTLYGEQLVYYPQSLSGGTLNVDDIITGQISGATGRITNVQSAANKIYYVSTNAELFEEGETISTSSGTTAIIVAGGVTGQDGFVLVADGFNKEPKPGGSISLAGDTQTYIIQSVSGTYTNTSSVLTIVLANEKVTPSADNTAVTVRYQYSNARLTGHDFLSVGTGNKTTTNYPGTPTQAASQANEVIEVFPGRVFYVSTDQDGNFRVGDYFRVDQATGRATLNASAFDLSGLTSLRLGAIGAQLGVLVNEFSSDSTLSGNSNEAVPTEAAVRNYFPQVATNIAPVEDDVYTLGTPSKRWNHVYVGPGSITIGSLVISDNAGTLSVTTSGNPAPSNITEIDTGRVRYYDNNIVGSVSNEDINITANGTGNVVINNDVTLAGQLQGPATFYIDPAAYGDESGTVVIRGSLQVDGTTTTVNSTEVDLDVKNLTLAAGATSASQANGAGITIDGANATLTYVDVGDQFEFNKALKLKDGVAITEFSIDGTLSGNSDSVVPTEKATKSYVNDFQAATFEPTGFSRGNPNTMGVFEFTLDGTTIYSVDQNSTMTTRADGKFATGRVGLETAATPRTLAIFPAAGQEAFIVWQSGIKYTFNTLQKASFAAGGPNTHYFFFDQGVLSAYNNITGDYIQKLPFIAEVYCDEATNTVIVLGEERHGITMDGATHLYLHNTSGTKYKSGLGINGISTGATTYTSTVGGVIYDEDIAITLDNQNTNRMLYQIGNDWKATAATNSFAYLVGGIAQYNLKTGLTYSLSDIPVGNYAVMYFIATNCRVNQMMKIMGQRVFTSLAAARESAQTEPRDTSLLGLPSPEFLYVGAVIVDRSGQVQTLDDGSNFVDLRLVNISAGTNSSSAVTSSASDSFYVNSTSGLSAANVQSALDELAAEKLDLAGGTMTGALIVNNSGGITTSGVIAANGASGITTTQTTFPLINTTATTVNFAGAATAVNIGAATGTLTFNNPTVNVNNASGVYQINGTTVLNSTTLGSGVTSSSLTSVGTIATGTWNATTIATNKGGTGLTSFTNNGAVYATSTSVLTTGTLPIASGGTNATSFTAKSGNVAGLVFFDGTSLTNDATVTDAGYDTSTHTLRANNFNASGTTTIGTLTGLLKASTGAVSAASAGTDYVAPGGALGTPSSGTLSNCTVDGTYSVGYKKIPPVGAKTTSYTIAAADVGKYVEIQSGGSVTLPAATFTSGDALTIYNNTTGSITITCSAVTTYIAGANSVKTSVSLATRGIATILFNSASDCVISGNVS